jgi:hypothetical protein
MLILPNSMSGQHFYEQKKPISGVLSLLVPHWVSSRLGRVEKMICGIGFLKKDSTRGSAERVILPLSPPSGRGGRAKETLF